MRLVLASLLALWLTLSAVFAQEFGEQCYVFIQAKDKKWSETAGPYTWDQAEEVRDRIRKTYTDRTAEVRCYPSYPWRN